MSVVTNDINGSNKVCLECNRQFTGIISACPHDGTALVDLVKDPMLGQVLANNYEILSIIGHGGMGIVYKDKHLLMDRYVAIKMLHASSVTNAINYKRLQQEGKATSRLNHPNVITVYDFDIAPTGQPYIVMDFLSGIGLSDIIKKNGHISVERTLNIIMQCCDGLSHAHKQGVVHRDLKPTNIMLLDNDDGEDKVKIVDFGVAKIVNESSEESQRLTKVGEICGSPVYMSPEQCQGLELDRRSDIYSLGIVLFESLTGELPFFGKTTMETMSMHLNMPPPKLSEIRPDLYIPERIEHVIGRALAKNKEDRYQNMDEFKMALETSIPRPSRSSILRTTNEATDELATQETQPKSKKLVYVIIGLSLTLIIGVFLFFRLTGADHSPSVKPIPAQSEKNQSQSLKPMPAQNGADQSSSVKPIPTQNVNKKNQAEGNSKIPLIKNIPTKIEPPIIKPDTTNSVNTTKIVKPQQIIEKSPTAKAKQSSPPKTHIKPPYQKSESTSTKPKPILTKPIQKSNNQGGDPFSRLLKERSY